MRKIPQPIPYQGSKRNIAEQIFNYVPPQIDQFIEPFAGSAALSISAATLNRARRFWLNDLNAPLMALLEMIITAPAEISDKYSALWHQQFGREKEHYNEVRDEFNQTHQPELLLYLLARCVKASVRYNSRGEFNQGPDNRRRGRHPSSMRSEIFAVSQLLKGKTVMTSLDYQRLVEVINSATDFVYMDPPYQGTSTARDPRYYRSLDVHEIVGFLEKLNNQDVMYALSYDGHKAGVSYGIRLPDYLGLERVEIKAGRSSQSTLLGYSHVTYESLYLSPALQCTWRVQRPASVVSNAQLQLGLFKL